MATISEFYKSNPAQFIVDHGYTFDPHVSRDPIPFTLFPRQIEWVDWVVDCWQAGIQGYTVKTRDVGVSSLIAALSCTLAIFNPGIVIGISARKLAVLDTTGDYHSLFERARFFLSLLPLEFRDTPTTGYAKIEFSNGSLIIGESEHHMGQGPQKSIQFLDDANAFARLDIVDTCLAQQTKCRIDVGFGAVYTVPKRCKSIFKFEWTDDPRKDSAWRERVGKYIGPSAKDEIDLEGVSFA
jgi:phage terminase large subunit